MNKCTEAPATTDPLPPGTLLIAEIGLAHDGSLGTAHAYIDAVAKAGARAVKFQVHDADAESTAREPWRARFSLQDRTRQDYWRRTAFDENQWTGLRSHARDAGLLFIASPFSNKATELIEALDVDFWKVASGEVSNIPLLQSIGRVRLPVLLSTGMSTLAEVDRAVTEIARLSMPFVVMQCTSEYPCPPQRVGLNLLVEYRRRYGAHVGLSDHSGTIYPAIAAAVLGARVVELHVCWTREVYGPDVTSSITIDELRVLSEALRYVDAMLPSPVDKDTVAAEMGELRRIFSHSVVASKCLRAGHLLQFGDIAFKKPGDGIPAAEAGSVVGRRLVRPVRANEQIHHDDLS